MHGAVFNVFIIFNIRLKTPLQPYYNSFFLRASPCLLATLQKSIKLNKMKSELEAYHANQEDR